MPQEPEQNEERKLEIKSNVPLDAFYKCWHMGSRLDKGYYIVDLLTDILSSGASSRMHQKLVKEKKLFSSISCQHFGSTDAGLVVVEGKLVKGVEMKEAETAVEEELEKMKTMLVSKEELQKVKNKTESAIIFEDMSLMSRAASLAYYEILGNASWMNDELGKYAAVTEEDILKESQKIFRKENSSTIYYLSEN